MYPIINHIQPLLDAISRLPEEQGSDFKHSVNHDLGYQVITYHSLNQHETFPDIVDQNDLLLRECRGIIFDLEGHVISRPFHKFWNLGERSEVQNVTIDSNNHTCLEKLDGSLIRPIPFWDNGEISHFRLGTKAGVTEVSQMAERWLESQPVGRQMKIKDFIYKCLQNHQTPIFEYCSLENRIVIVYEEADLILTAIRNNHSGEYVDHDVIKDMVPPEITVVKQLPAFDNQMINEYKKSGQDQEGFVLRMNDGQFIKVKNDWYCLLHKTKESINFEKNVLKIILEENLDDLMPLLNDFDREKILAYAYQVNHNIKLMSDYVVKWVEIANDSCEDRKQVAKKMIPLIQKQNLPELLPIFWKTYDGNNAFEELVNYLIRQCGSQSSVDKARNIIGASY